MYTNSNFGIQILEHRRKKFQMNSDKHLTQTGIRLKYFIRKVIRFLKPRPYMSVLLERNRFIMELYFFAVEINKLEDQLKVNKMQQHEMKNTYHVWPKGLNKDGLFVEAEYSYLAVEEFVRQKGLKTPNNQPSVLLCLRSDQKNPKSYVVTYKQTVICDTLTRIKSCEIF